MPAKTTIIDINLVPKDPFFDTLLGRALRWALSAGRYIVMFTELIVVLSFVTRFYLDRQVTDLNKSIFQKESLIASYGTFEQQLRDVQEQITQYQQVEQKENLADIFPALSEVIPTGVQLEELVIYPDKVTLAGKVLSQRSLNILINNLQLSTHFHNIVVNTIESEGPQSAGFTFKLSAQTQQQSPGTALRTTPQETPSESNDT